MKHKQAPIKHTAPYSDKHLAFIKYCGWEWKENCVRDVKFECWDDGWFNAKLDQVRRDLPLYDSLDELHEVEKRLNKMQRATYVAELEAIIQRHTRAGHELPTFKFITASAEQRYKALFKMFKGLDK